MAEQLCYRNNNETIRAIVIEDNKLHRLPIKLHFDSFAELEGIRFDIDLAASKEEAEELLKKNKYEIGLFDLNLPDNLEGVELLKGHGAAVRYPVVLTSEKDDGVISKVFDLGFKNYVIKPCGREKIFHLIKNYFLKINEEKARKILLSNYVTQDNDTIEELLKIPRFTLNKDPIYIHGATGTGKEVVAKLIHQFTQKKDAPFIVADGGNFTDGLAESKLFGHKKGAFTGAVSDQKGLFELANGGILFIDEIGKMPLSIQTRLLRVLQEKNFSPVGSTTLIPVDVRIITASKENLDDLVRDGRFHEDFKERVLGNQVRLAPLCDRPDDILFQLNHFIHKHPSGRAIRITDDAFNFLRHYFWPGNTRELIKVVNQWQTKDLSEIRVKDLSDLQKREAKELYGTINQEFIQLVETKGLNFALEKLKCDTVQYFHKKNNFKARKSIKQLGMGPNTFYKYLRPDNEPGKDTPAQTSSAR